jgi:hypothetical protein
MNFKNFYLLQEEVKHNFCYMVFLDQPYIDYIGEIQRDIFGSGEFQAKELVKPEELHCTVRHVKLSYGQTPEKFLAWMDDNDLPTLDGFTEKFSLFDEQTLVIELDSPQIREWFEKVNSWITTVGGYAESDYKVFKPHISIAYGFQGTDVPTFDSRKHRMKMKFPNHKVTDQNYDVIYERTADDYDPNLGFGVLSGM